MVSGNPQGWEAENTVFFNMISRVLGRKEINPMTQEAKLMGKSVNRSAKTIN